MRALPESDYRALRETARVLEQDGHGEKVLTLADGRFLKLFRHKRRFSSSRLYPYARRFADNAAALRRVGVPTVASVEVWRIDCIDRDAVFYEPLPGRNIRKVVADSEDGGRAVLAELPAFIALLHRKGVYFRSLHLGNVLVLPEGGMGLIDVSDMRVGRAALSVRLRARNLAHLFNNRDDRQLLAEHGHRLFLDRYLEAAGLKPVQRSRVRRRLGRRLKWPEAHTALAESPGGSQENP